MKKQSTIRHWIWAAILAGLILAATPAPADDYLRPDGLGGYRGGQGSYRPDGGLGGWNTPEGSMRPDGLGGFRGPGDSSMRSDGQGGFNGDSGSMRPDGQGGYRTSEGGSIRPDGLGGWRIND